MHTSISKALATLALAAFVAMPAHAQGKGKGKEKHADKGKDKDKVTVVTTSNGEVLAVNRPVVVRQKHVTMPQAVSVTRDVLVANGYQVTQVVPSGATQVIYFRRGNRGNGRGLGPVERIVVVPSGQVVQFQSVPEPLLTTILRRLGM